MTRLQQTLARNLKHYREERGLSQAQLAEKAGLSLNFLSMIEIARKFPGPENIEGLASALSVKPFHLFLDLDHDWAADDLIAAKLLSGAYVDKMSQVVREATLEYFKKEPS